MLSNEDFLKRYKDLKIKLNSPNLSVRERRNVEAKLDTLKTEFNSNASSTNAYGRMPATQKRKFWKKQPVMRLVQPIRHNPSQAEKTLLNKPGMPAMAKPLTSERPITALEKFQKNLKFYPKGGKFRSNRPFPKTREGNDMHSDTGVNETFTE